MSKKEPRPEFEDYLCIKESVIDTHAHLDRQNYQEIIRDMKKNKLEKIVTVSGNLETLEFANNLSREYKDIYFISGVHPYDLEEFNGEYVAKLRKVRKNNSHLVGIGEFGLDYHGEMKYTKEVQKEYFIKQLKLADELNLPVVLHIRDANEDAINLLKAKKNLLRCGGIIHCFSGNSADAKEFLELGFYISFSGSITYSKKNQVYELENVLKIVPADKILIETDSPFLCPSPYRGEINEPKYVLVTAKRIADILNLTTDEIIRLTKENAKRILKIK